MDTAVRRYYRGATLVAMRDLAAGECSYYHCDDQGTVQSLTSESGSITDSFVSDAWGNQIDRNGSSVNPLWFRGCDYYYTSRSGRECTYAGDRWLSTSLGRWISRGHYPNPYAFSGNSPALAQVVMPKSAEAEQPKRPLIYAVGRECKPSKDSCNTIQNPVGDGRSCDDLCKEYHGKYNTVSTAGMIGGIICYSGKKCVCLFVTTSVNYYPKDCDLIDDCHWKHEEQHCDDVQCDPKKSDFHRPPFSSNEALIASECPKRKESIACLSGAEKEYGIRSKDKEKSKEERALASECRDNAKKSRKVLEQWVGMCCGKKTPPPDACFGRNA